MTGQQRETLLDLGHDPLKAGISHRFIDGIFINTPAWHHANDSRDIIGSCRQPKCGGLLQAIDTHTENKITWYAAECLNCGHEVTAPNGRVLARSSRLNEMPDGWWSRRIDTLRRLAKAGHTSEEAA